MPVTMDDVRAALDPEEPDYGSAAALGEEALPHLESLARGDDAMLASKATYAASLIGGAQAVATVQEAARSGDPVVRVAAAAAAANLDAAAASGVLEPLVGDADPGVRKVARGAVPAEVSPELARTLSGLADDAATDSGVVPLDPATIQGLMPGESPDPPAPAESHGLMPGESLGDMPG